MQHRREIDGLRAVAVVPVILFHAGFQRMAGGYVGVDVFFVISGYLITRVIQSERQLGRFTLAGFYERRARRILPALFVVVCACMPPAWVLLSPYQLRDFAQSIMAVMLFASNFLFWRESGYFASDAAEKPLLHTWSLGVEEQYYLFFPLVVLGLSRLPRRWLASSLLFAALVSLGSSQYLVTKNPSAAFYATPTRAWELLLGALAALVGSDARGLLSVGPKLAEWGSGMGLVMIAAAIFGFDQATPFPGLAALLPTMGTALVIGLANEETVVGRFLALPPLVGIGLISYSAYLWHQPILAFAKAAGADDSLWMALASLLAIALAYPTWRFIERPCRDRALFSRRTVLAASALGSAVLFGIGVLGHWSRGVPGRYNAEQLAVFSLEKYMGRAPYRLGTCFLGETQHAGDFAPECLQPLQTGKPGILLWGDSHAASLFSGLQATLPGAALAQLTASGCPPALGVEVPSRPSCREINDRVLALVPQGAKTAVLLLADWSAALGLEEIRSGLRQTVNQLRSRGARVVLVGSLPQWQTPLPALIAHQMFLGGKRLNDLPQRQHTTLLQSLENADRWVRSVATESGAGFVSILDRVCQGSDCDALVLEQGEPRVVVWDDAHLTEWGARHVAQKISSRMIESLNRGMPPGDTLLTSSPF